MHFSAWESKCNVSGDFVRNQEKLTLGENDLAVSNWILNFGPGPIKSQVFVCFFVTSAVPSTLLNQQLSLHSSGSKCFYRVNSEITKELNKALLNLFTCWWVAIVCLAIYCFFSLSCSVFKAKKIRRFFFLPLCFLLISYYLVVYFYMWDTSPNTRI